VKEGIARVCASHAPSDTAQGIVELAEEAAHLARQTYGDRAHNVGAGQAREQQCPGPMIVACA